MSASETYSTRAVHLSPASPSPTLGLSSCLHLTANQHSYGQTYHALRQNPMVDTSTGTNGYHFRLVTFSLGLDLGRGKRAKTVTVTTNALLMGHDCHCVVEEILMSPCLGSVAAIVLRTGSEITGSLSKRWWEVLYFTVRTVSLVSRPL